MTGILSGKFLVIAIIIGVVLLLLIGGTVWMLWYTFGIAKKVYNYMFVKANPESKERVCSAPDNEEQVQMWEDGIAWAAQYKDRIKEVSMENEGFKLYGEYFDFGGDGCVIILPGRMECLTYSYHFAEPYRQAGMNVLVVDQRAKGLSDGIYEGLGIVEYKDTMAWMRKMREEFGVKRFWLHGICLGAQNSILAATDPNCPEGLEGITLDGAFSEFSESFKEHMIDINKPVFPVLQECMYLFKKNVGVDQKKAAPKRHVQDLRVRTLFIHSKIDKFSVPALTQKLYDACGAPEKKLEWFPKGCHSHVRINNREHYDETIVKFVTGAQ